MIPYLRLIRLPNVFTALADIIAGYFLATHALSLPTQPLVFAALCGASACLYLAGMAFNDIADRDEDARVRPGRPIPSGTVSLRGAVCCAALLMLAGWALAAVAGRLSLLVAAILALAILAYDFAFKGRTFAGPLALGVCRCANVLLGMSAPFFIWMTTERLRESGISQQQLDVIFWIPAIASGLYGAGVTAFSAQEEEGKKRGAIGLGWIFTGAGLLAAGALFLVPKIHAAEFAAIGFVPLAILASRLVSATRVLVRSGSTDAARGLVLAGVKGYCPLDASMLLLFGGTALWLPALAAIALFFPGGWLRKALAQKEA